DMVRDALRQSGLAPEYLELELTETAILRDEQIAAESLGQLRRLGLSIAIDDFGTGYASLNYLRCLPISRLKIASSFVQDLARGEDPRLIRALIDLGHALGLQVIAEGVETESQATTLRAYGCDEGQGYYFGKPLSVERMTTL